MPIERFEFWKAARAGVVFLFLFLVGFPISYMRIFSDWRSPQSMFLVFIDNQIWFYPQTVLPPGFQVVDSRSACQEVISPPVAMLLSLLFWAVIVVCFAWVSRNLRFRFTVPLAALTIIFAPILVYMLLNIISIEPEFIGP